MAICNSYYDGFDYKEGENWKDYDKRTTARFNQIIESSKGLPDEEILGKVISFPVADGRAMYHVIKSKPLTLVHIPYGDAYQIPDAHIRGLRKSDVVAMVKADNSLRKLFSKKS